MKIINSIEDYYYKQLELNRILRSRVDHLIKYHKKSSWHYDSRIKDLESFALKVETGNIEDPSNMNDFFACSIIVENTIMLQDALLLVEKHFDIVEKKPSTPDFTPNAPDSFAFDDLRLYVRLKPDAGQPFDSGPNKLCKVVFEVQIKTFLQHAWSLATHDLTYKGDEVNWAKQRIAYQIKAMLEHAEISIREIEKIKDCTVIAKKNRKFDQLNKINKFLLKNWQRDFLPGDIMRLTANVHHILNGLEINLNELQECLDAESSAGRGVKTLNLSPYCIILQSIINQKPQKLKSFLSHSTSEIKIFIPREIDTKSLSLENKK
jgi:ppGpp synthetase/RelA/SpoT-type nucleotidyltranferase